MKSRIPFFENSCHYWVYKWIKEVCSKILILLETSGGISFSLEGFKNNRDLQFKTLRREIYILLEGFRYLLRGFLILLERFRYPSRGFITPLERFRYSSRGFIIPLEGFRYPTIEGNKSTGGIQISFQGFFNSTGAI